MTTDQYKAALDAMPNSEWADHLWGNWCLSRQEVIRQALTILSQPREDMALQEDDEPYIHHCDYCSDKMCCEGIQI